MGSQGGGLVAQVGTHIDTVGDLGLWCPGGVELGRIELAGGETGARCQMPGPGDRLPRQGGLEQSRGSRAECLCCADRSVHLQVVGVAVAARGVIADENIGSFLIAHLGDAAPHRESPNVSEAVGILAVQAGVGVAQEHRATDSEGPGGCGELLPPGRSEIISELRGRQTGLTVGGHDEDDAVPLPGCSGHGPGGQQRLVVRMCMDEDEGACGHDGHCGVRSLGVRIAHVSDCFAPRTGGIESQVKALATRQAASGRDVRVITATPGHDGVRSGLDLVDGPPVHRVVANLPFELPVHPRTRVEVGRVLDADPVDVVHVHAGVISPFAWGAVRAARDRRLPVLVTVHSVWGPLARPAFGLSDALGRWSSWGVTLSAVSDLAAEHVHQSVPRAGQVLVVPNGIDPEEWQIQPGPPDPQVLRLVTVMRLAPRKRTLPLVHMIEQARAALAGTVDVTATIVGDGPVRQRAERQITSRGLADAVRFTGRLDRPGILEVFAHSDAYVQPSVKESFGLAALEARTSGLPVVARTQSGTTQFIHDGVEGLLASDDSGMVAALARLGRDPDLLSRLADHNRSTPPQETWSHVLETVDAAYVSAGARG